MYEISLILIGSILTFLGSIIFEFIKTGNEKKLKRKNFKLIIKQEFNSIVKKLDKLKTAFEYKSYFDYAIIDSLGKNIKSLENSGKDAIYLNNVNIQEKLIDLTADLSDFIIEIKGIQDIFYDQQRKLDGDDINKKDIESKKKTKTSIFKDHKENNELFIQKSTQKFIDLVEIRRRLDELIKILE